MEICESLLFNSWSFSSVKQCVKMTSHSFRNPFLRSYLRAFLRFFSSAFSFWAKVKDSASARLSTAMARKTFRRMTESRPSQDYNHCETFTHKHKPEPEPEPWTWWGYSSHRQRGWWSRGWLRFQACWVLREPWFRRTWQHSSLLPSGSENTPHIKRS